jgi:hypothetical protein
MPELTRTLPLQDDLSIQTAAKVALASVGACGREAPVPRIRSRPHG